jgi:hypothetical protein
MGGWHGRNTRLHRAVSATAVLLVLTALRGGPAGATPDDGAVGGPDAPAAAAPVDAAGGGGASDADPVAGPDGDAPGPVGADVDTSDLQVTGFTFAPEPVPAPIDAAGEPVDPQVAAVDVTGNCFDDGDLRWWLRNLDDPAAPVETGTAPLDVDGAAEVSIPTGERPGTWGILVACPYDGSGMPTYSDARTYRFGGGTLPTVTIGPSPEDPSMLTAAVQRCVPIGEGTTVLEVWWAPMVSVEVPTVDGSASAAFPAVETFGTYANCVEVADGYRQPLQSLHVGGEMPPAPPPPPPDPPPLEEPPVTIHGPGVVSDIGSGTGGQERTGPRFTPIRLTEVRGATIAATGSSTLLLTATAAALLTVGLLSERAGRRRVAALRSSTGAADRRAGGDR